jgi:hypothetical protein
VSTATAPRPLRGCRAAVKNALRVVVISAAPGVVKKGGRTTTLKFLIACALIAAMSETAMAQQMTPPEKCQKLNLTDFIFEHDQSGNIALYALVHNDAPYNLTSASFTFDLLVGDLKVGEAWTNNIGRLSHGNKERVHINISSINQDLKGYIAAGTVVILPVSSACNFSP